MAFFRSGLWSASQELYKTGSFNLGIWLLKLNVSKMIILPQFTFLKQYNLDFLGLY